MKSKHEIEMALKESLANLFGVLPDDAFGELNRGDFENWDSVQELKLVISLEELFGIDIDLDTFATQETLSDILNLIVELTHKS